MPTSYPGGLDTFTNPTDTDTLADPSHADQHANANDAIEAIEAALGINLENLPKGQLAYAEVTSDQATITTETDLTGLTVTPTLVAGRRIRVTTWYRLSATGTVPVSTIPKIYKAGSVIAIARVPMNVTSATGQTIAHVSHVFTSSAESPIIKATLEASSSVTMVASATARAYILVEDLGKA